MYLEHQPVISKYARQSPDNFANVIKFVFCTIQQPLDVSVRQASGLNTEDKLFGFKLKAWLNVKENKESLYQVCENAWQTRDKVAIMDALTECHGLGLVKAGFVTQLIYGFGGCIDRHNLARFGISYNQVNLNKKLKHSTKLAKIRQYLYLTNELGGCKYLWDSWCQHVADKNPNRYANAQEVSHLHIIGATT